MSNCKQLKAINFDVFIEGVSIVAAQGYNDQTKHIISDELNMYFDCMVKHDESHEVIDKLNIPLNQVIGYCWLILEVCKNLESEHNKGDLINKEQFEYVQWCIGDLTSRVGGNRYLHMGWTFTPHNTKNRIIASLVILSKLPFENDGERRKFNKLVEHYKSLGGEELKYLTYDDPGYCYIATMVYGSYDHPSVVILRQYRDTVLSKTTVGVIFIKFYYKISPKIVVLLKGNERINYYIKKILNLFIKRLS